MFKVAHFEIPAEDIEKTKDFYGNIFGWKFKNWGEAGDYVITQTVPGDSDGKPIETGGINGGIQKKSDRAKAVTFVIEVDDIDKILKEIESKGGVIVVPKESMGGMGYYAQFDDPEGNRLGVFQANK